VERIASAAQNSSQPTLISQPPPHRPASASNPASTLPSDRNARHAQESPALPRLGSLAISTSGAASFPAQIAPSLPQPATAPDYFSPVALGGVPALEMGTFQALPSLSASSLHSQTHALGAAAGPSPLPSLAGSLGPSLGSLVHAPIPGQPPLAVAPLQALNTPALSLVCASQPSILPPTSLGGQGLGAPGLSQAASPGGPGLGAPGLSQAAPLPFAGFGSLGVSQHPPSGVGMHGYSGAGLPPLGSAGLPALGSAGLPPLGSAGLPPLGSAGLPPLGSSGLPALGGAASFSALSGNIPSLGAGLPSLALSTLPTLAAGPSPFGSALPALGAGLPALGISVPGPAVAAPPRPTLSLGSLSDMALPQSLTDMSKLSSLPGLAIAPATPASLSADHPHTALAHGSIGVPLPSLLALHHQQLTAIAAHPHHPHHPTTRPLQQRAAHRIKPAGPAIWQWQPSFFARILCQPRAHPKRAHRLARPVQLALARATSEVRRNMLSHPRFTFSTPSPDDVVLLAQQGRPKPAAAPAPTHHQGDDADLSD
jgi:hypothetical protein